MKISPTHFHNLFDNDNNNNHNHHAVCTTTSIPRFQLF